MHESDPVQSSLACQSLQLRRSGRGGGGWERAERVTGVGRAPLDPFRPSMVRRSECEDTLRPWPVPKRVQWEGPRPGRTRSARVTPPSYRTAVLPRRKVSELDDRTVGDDAVLRDDDDPLA